ncbi:phage tail assembly protein [Thioclava sp. BHET1]|nr:phage tail assembly protein [Thioclava sp. BHET1]
MSSEIKLPKVKEIELDKALEFNGGTYQTLRLREFTVGEWDRAQTHNGDTAQMIALMTAVSGWPEPVIRQLPMSSYNAGMAYLMGFFTAGLPTGDSSE